MILSRPTVTAAILALAALALVAPQTLLMTVPFGIALLATYRYPARLEGVGSGRWLLRLGLICGAYALIRVTGATMRSEYLVGTAWGRNFFGLVFAAEMTIQAWRARVDNPRAPLLVAFCAGMTFLTACNTFDDPLIPWITPVFILALALGLRTYRPHQAGADRGATRIATRARVGALIAVIAIGLPTQHVISMYHMQLTEWGNNLLLQHAAEILDSSGMSDEPFLGETFGLRGSPERVLRVSPVTNDQEYVSDPHLRGLSFDTYDLGRWGPAVGERTLAEPADADMRVRRLSPAGRASTRLYRVTRLTGGNPLVYAPLGSSEIDLSDAENLVWAPNDGGPIRTNSAPPYSYTIGVPLDDRFQGIMARRPTQMERKRCLTIPSSLDPHVVVQARRQLAALALLTDAPARHRAGGARRGVRATASELAERKIDLIVGYLQLHHHYSLTFNPGSGDPVSAFLLSDGSGAHCEYFASAAALLLRCEGIPSRYVIGYYLHESEGHGVDVVRQRDAHAWAEAWIDGVGWEVVDATPGDGLPDFDPEPIPGMQKFWERLEDAVQSVRDWLGDLRPDQVNLVVGAVTVVTLVGGAVWLAVRRRRANKEQAGGEPFVYTQPAEELAALGSRLDRILAELEIMPPETVPRTEYLAARIAANPSLESDFWQRAHRFAARYDSVRFGIATAGGDVRLRASLEALEHDLTALEEELWQTRAMQDRTRGNGPWKGISAGKP